MGLEIANTELGARGKDCAKGATNCKKVAGPFSRPFPLVGKMLPYEERPDFFNNMKACAVQIPDRPTEQPWEAGWGPHLVQKKEKEGALPLWIRSRGITSNKKELYLSTTYYIPETLLYKKTK